MRQERKALDWTEEELEDLAETSPADQERAAQWWKRNAEKEAQEILDAATEDIPLE